MQERLKIRQVVKQVKRLKSKNAQNASKISTKANGKNTLRSVILIANGRSRNRWWLSVPIILLGQVMKLHRILDVFITKKKFQMLKNNHSKQLPPLNQSLLHNKLLPEFGMVSPQISQGLQQTLQCFATSSRKISQRRCLNVESLIKSPGTNSRCNKTTSCCRIQFCKRILQLDKQNKKNRMRSNKQLQDLISWVRKTELLRFYKGN